MMASLPLPFLGGWRRSLRPRALQQTLLPDAGVDCPFLQIETVYEPATEVGGDFHWRRVNPDGSLTLVVGDVSGKGLRAAMLVSVAIGILRNEKSKLACRSA